MMKQDFMAARRARWERLEKVLRRLETAGAKRMAPDELDEFVHLYRMACSDLAKARSEELGQNVEAYLNTIVARGHKQFRLPTSPSLKIVLDFILRDFPRAVRSMKWSVLTATALFVVPLLVAAAIVLNNPASAYSLAPPEMLETLTDAYAKGHHGGRSESEDTLMTGFYINNNVGIAFQCFATGVFFGLGAIFALLFNGIIIGAIGGYVCASGFSESFLSFVVGHGSFELTAIVLAGAMGIRLGMILVNPGPWRRLDAFKIHSTPILRVVLGSGLMLVIAAFIEGFWSPSGVAPIIKFIVGGALWGLVLLYLLLAGRGEQGMDSESDMWKQEDVQ